MSHLATLLQRFSKDESGAALVEYAVIFAILIAGSVAVMTTIGDNVLTLVTAVETQLGVALTALGLGGP